MNGLPVNNHIRQLCPRVVVEDDAIRKALTGDRFNFPAESQVYAIKYGMIRTLIQQGYEVLVDDTHTTEISIKRLIEIDTNADFVFIDTDVDECIQRAINTNQTDLVGVIQRHHANLRRLTGTWHSEHDLPTGIKGVIAIADKVVTIRHNVIDSLEHTKRV